jgi:hypothetical protein
MEPTSKLELYVQLLEKALLNMRMHANRGDCAACAVEVDHVHNLPELIRLVLKGDTTGARRAEMYYWNTERLAYVRNRSGASSLPFEPLWQDLARYVEATKATDQRRRPGGESR